MMNDIFTPPFDSKNAVLEEVRKLSQEIKIKEEIASMFHTRKRNFKPSRKIRFNDEVAQSETKCPTENDFIRESMMISEKSVRIRRLLIKHLQIIRNPAAIVDSCPLLGHTYDCPTNNTIKSQAEMIISKPLEVPSSIFQIFVSDAIRSNISPILLSRSSLVNIDPTSVFNKSNTSNANGNDQDANAPLIKELMSVSESAASPTSKLILEILQSESNVASNVPTFEEIWNKFKEWSEDSCKRLLLSHDMHNALFKNKCSSQIGKPRISTADLSNSVQAMSNIQKTVMESIISSWTADNTANIVNYLSDCSFDNEMFRNAKVLHGAVFDSELSNQVTDVEVFDALINVIKIIGLNHRQPQLLGETTSEEGVEKCESVAGIVVESQHPFQAGFLANNEQCLQYSCSKKSFINEKEYSCVVFDPRSDITAANCSLTLELSRNQNSYSASQFQSSKTFPFPSNPLIARACDDRNTAVQFNVQLEKHDVKFHSHVESAPPTFVAESSRGVMSRFSKILSIKDGQVAYGLPQVEQVTDVRNIALDHRLRSTSWGWRFACFECESEKEANLILSVARCLARCRQKSNCQAGNEKKSWLHEACYYGNIFAIQYFLVACHCDVNKPLYGEDASTPLHEAVRGGNIYAVALLLAHGANPYAEDVNHCTAIQMASDLQDDSISKYISHFSETKASVCGLVFNCSVIAHYKFIIASRLKAKSVLRQSKFMSLAQALKARNHDARVGVIQFAAHFFDCPFGGDIMSCAMRNLEQIMPLWKMWPNSWLNLFLCILGGGDVSIIAFSKSIILSDSDIQAEAMLEENAEVNKNQVSDFLGFLTYTFAGSMPDMRTQSVELKDRINDAKELLYAWLVDSEGQEYSSLLKIPSMRRLVIYQLPMSPSRGSSDSRMSMRRASMRKSMITTSILSKTSDGNEIPNRIQARNLCSVEPVAMLQFMLPCRSYSPIVGKLMDEETTFTNAWTGRMESLGAATLCLELLRNLANRK